MSTSPVVGSWSRALGPLGGGGAQKKPLLRHFGHSDTQPRIEMKYNPPPGSVSDGRRGRAHTTVDEGTAQADSHRACVKIIDNSGGELDHVTCVEGGHVAWYRECVWCSLAGGGEGSRRSAREGGSEITTLSSSFWTTPLSPPPPPPTEIMLEKRPLKEVVVNATEESGQVQIYPPRLVFDPFNFGEPQVVRVVARDDTRDETASGRKPCVIRHHCVSADPEYSGANVMVRPDQINVDIIDNDAPYLFSFGDGADGKLGNLGNKDQVVDVPRFVSLMSGGELQKMTTISGASMRKKLKHTIRSRTRSEDENDSSSSSLPSGRFSPGQHEIQSAIVDKEDE